MVLDMKQVLLALTITSVIVLAILQRPTCASELAEDVAGLRVLGPESAASPALLPLVHPDGVERDETAEDGESKASGDAEEVHHDNGQAQRASAPGLQTKCGHRQEPHCGWHFVRYLPSPFEQQWWDRVDELGYPGADVCEHVRGEQFQMQFHSYRRVCGTSLTAKDRAPFPKCHCSNNSRNLSLDYDPEVFSRFEYADNCTGEVRHTFIEPLVGILRHPLTCKDYYKWILRKDWIVLDQWSLYRDLPLDGRHYYFDAGASTWRTGKGGASQSWFNAVYKSQCAVFDGYWMWEAEVHNPLAALKHIPGDVMPKYHWFNAPATIPPTSKFSPLFHIKAVARPDDFVMFKLDIDNNQVEEGIVRHILADKSLQALIDELFWEHHINMNPIANRSWKFGETFGKTVGQRHSIGLFRRLREAGIRAHSWV